MIGDSRHVNWGKDALKKMSCFINLLSQTNAWRIIKKEGSTKFLRKIYKIQDTREQQTLQ